MQNFIKQERVDPKKRGVVQRIKDFGEIYEIFGMNEAALQSERCVQCGDPYCLNRCPLHNFIPHWLKAVAEKDLELAFRLSNESSPFPEIMGRVCPHEKLCEGACTLNEGYGAITIGSVETYISEEGFKKGFKPEFPGITTDKKVAIIGSGPAGLSAATYLLRAGIAVDMYERADRPGGLLTYGIPGFKLDKKVIFRRINLLCEAGLNLYLNTEVGKDIDFRKIMDEHDAVFIGAGATKGRKLGISKEDARGIYLAMEFLTNVQKKIFGDTYNKELDVKDKNVVVIGGGDTAMDCVRSSIREGARSVKCLYRRDAKNMPGSRKEYHNAIEEGAQFIFNCSPRRILTDSQNNVVGIEMFKTVLGPKDASGRQKAEEIKGSEFRVDADVIILALGFSCVPFAFLAENGIESNSWGGIMVNEHFETTKPGIYAGGDCTRGADLVVTAAFDGREAAKNIIKKLLG